MIEDGRKLAIFLFFILRKVIKKNKVTKMPKRLVQFMKKVLQMIKHVKSGLKIFVLEFFLHNDIPLLG